MGYVYLFPHNSYLNYSSYFIYLQDSAIETPVVMVGNKVDQVGDRMVTTEEGQRRSKEIGCVCFHEISVRESIDQARRIFFFRSVASTADGFRDKTGRVSFSRTKPPQWSPHANSS